MTIDVETIGGKKFAVLNSKNLTPVMELIRVETDVGVLVSRRNGYSRSDLSTLEAMPNLTALIVSDDDLEPFDLSAVSKLSNLKLLHLYLNDEFDISVIEKLSKIEELRFGENGNQKYPNWQIPSLLKLYIDGFSGKNLEPLSVFPGLLSLELTAARRLENLNSLSCFPALQELILAYCPRLISLDGLRGVPALRKLDIDSVKNVESIVIPETLAHLKSLTITKSAKLMSVDWIPLLNDLRSLVFMDVNIANGDLLPLMTLHGLNHFVLRPYKGHYNVSAVELAKKFRNLETFQTN